MRHRQPWFVLERQQSLLVYLQELSSCNCNGCFENAIALVTILEKREHHLNVLTDICLGLCGLRLHRGPTVTVSTLRGENPPCPKSQYVVVHCDMKAYADYDKHFPCLVARA